MIYLLLSISVSVLTVLFFKVFERFGVNTFQAILANYISCMVLGSLISPEAIILTPFWTEPWFGFAAVLGFFFVTGFYAIGVTAQRLGVSVSMVAAKLSVVVPVVLAVVWHHEVLGWTKVAGIVLSLLAVVLISTKEQVEQIEKREVKWLWMFPAYVFLSSGINDSILNHIQYHFIPPALEGDILTIIFMCAFGWGVLLWLFKRESISIKSVGWGLLFGIPNYLSMFFLVKTLGAFDASYIFPINNTAIVLCSALVSVLLFKEHMSRRNWVGLAVAVVAILLIV